MENNFLESCKLLKKHYNSAASRTEASTQSENCDSMPNAAQDIINETKRLLLFEQLEALSDQDIENLRQNSVLKYAQTLESFIMPKSSVQRVHCTKRFAPWKDDLFDTNLTNLNIPKHVPRINKNPEKDSSVNHLENRNTSDHEGSRNERGERSDTLIGLDDLMNINIDESIDELLNKYTQEEDALKYRNKIKENVRKQREEVIEKLNEIRNKNTVSQKSHKVHKINSTTNRDDLMEHRIDNDINGLLQNKKLVLAEHPDHFDIDHIEADFHATDNIHKEACETKKKVIFCPNEDGNGREATNINKKSQNKDDTSDSKVKTTSQNVVELHEIPELNIIPQNKPKIETVLGISKIPLESDSQDNKNLLEKSFNKWKKLNQQKKSKPNDKTEKKIEKFLENLKNYKKVVEKSKSDLEKSEDTNNEKKRQKCISQSKVSPYENRYKAQSNIIQSLKTKVEEQNRIIEDLKLNKIKVLAQESLKNAQTEIRRSLPRTKCKQVKAESERDDMNNGLTLSLNLTKAPKIVQCMEERARLREEKRLLIKERKRIMEEEKKRQAEEAIQRKIKEEAEQKLKRLQKLKEQRKLARELEFKRQLEKKHFIEINEKARLHYKTKLIKSSMNKLKMLILNIRIKVEIANRFYENNITIKQFKRWKKYTDDTITYKNNTADMFYKNNLLQRCWDSWKIIYFRRIQNEQAAADRYDFSLQAKVFSAWHTLTCELHIQNRINFSKAKKKYIRNLMFQCFHSWRSFPAIMRIEKAQNERKREWRLRVANILPDYDPAKKYEEYY